MRKVAKRTVTALCILGVFLGSLPDEVVLCVGADGHVSIEFTPRPQWRHFDGAPTRYASVGETCDCENECGPCRDARLRSGDLTARRAESHERTAITPGPATPLAGAQTFVSASTFRERARSSPQNPISPPLRGTSVLLI